MASPASSQLVNDISLSLSNLFLKSFAIPYFWYASFFVLFVLLVGAYLLGFFNPILTAALGPGNPYIRKQRNLFGGGRVQVMHGNQLYNFGHAEYDEGWVEVPPAPNTDGEMTVVRPVSVFDENKNLITHLEDEKQANVPLSCLDENWGGVITFGNNELVQLRKQVKAWATAYNGLSDDLMKVQQTRGQAWADLAKQFGNVKTEIKWTSPPMYNSKTAATIAGQQQAIAESGGES